MKLINFLKKSITNITESILKVCISAVIFLLIFLTIIRLAEVITLNLNSNLDSVLVRLSTLLDKKNTSTAYHWKFDSHNNYSRNLCHRPSL